MFLSAQTQGIVAHLLGNLFWGIAGPIVKLALNDISPFTFVFLRMLLAIIILFPFVILRFKNQKFARSDFPLIFLIGFLGITLNIGFYFWGLSLTTVIDASIIVSTTSIFTALAAFLFLKEKISKIVSLGIILSFAGTVVIIAQPILEEGLFRPQNIFGNVFILLATWAWVGYIILNKRIGQKYDTLLLSYIFFLIGAVTFFPLAAQDIFSPVFYASLTPFLIFAILFETVFATILAYFLLTWGIKFISATTSGVISYINPIVAIIVSIMFLGEKITLPFIIGATFVVCGLFLAEARHPKHPLHKLHK